MNASVLLCDELVQIRTDKILEVTGDLQAQQVDLGYYDWHEIALPNLVVIGGDLRVSSVNVKLSLPSLLNVSGDVNVNSMYVSSLSRVELPSLRVVGGSFTYSSTRLVRLNASALFTVGQNFDVSGNNELSSIHVNGLQTVGGYFRIGGCDALTELSFESLAFVSEWFSIENNHALVAAYFNNLASVGSLEGRSTGSSADDNGGGDDEYNYYYSNDDRYVSEDSSTTYCDTSRDQVNVCIDGNSALETIEFQSLDFGSFGIGFTVGLCAVFDGLSSIQCGGHLVTSNATCDGTATIFSSTVVGCNDMYLFYANGVVAITGSLLLDSGMPADITSVDLPNLETIGQDLYFEPRFEYNSADFSFVHYCTSRTSLPNLVEIGGNLLAQNFDENCIMNLSFPSLFKVHGNIEFDGVRASNVDFPSLNNVGGNALFNLFSTAPTSVPALAVVGGSFSYYGPMIYLEHGIQATTTVSIELPSLRTVGRNLQFQGLNFVRTLSAPALKTVGGELAVFELCGGYGNPGCEYEDGARVGLDMNSLESVGSGFYIEGSDHLSSISASSLQTVGGPFNIQSISGRLTELSFESLAFVEGYFKIEDCDVLVNVYFSSLSSVATCTTNQCRRNADGRTWCGGDDDDDTAIWGVNLCIVNDLWGDDDDTALKTIAFPSLDYDSLDVSIPPGPPPLYCSAPTLTMRNILGHLSSATQV